MINKEKKSTAIKYNEYIVYGDPTEYEFTTVERKKAAKYGILFNSEKLAFNFMMYHNKILQEQYFYTKEDVANIFDFNVSFVQKFLRTKDFKMLYVSKSSRDILKSAYEIKFNKYYLEFEKQKEYLIVNYEKYEQQKKIYKLALELLKKIDYDTKIYYRKLDILKWIKNNFYRETFEGDLLEITTIEALEIFNHKLVSNKTLKKILDKKHDMQVTRIIKANMLTNNFKKYIMFNLGNKRPVIRYMILNNK